MLPPANSNGDLPQGVHTTSWPEIEQRFGGGSPARVRACARLRHLYELAKRTGQLRNFYVFGSFVSTAIAEPADVDIVLVMDGDFTPATCEEESRVLFSHAAAQTRHQATVFWLRQGALSEGLMEQLMRSLQTRRDGTLRGILEIA